MIEQMINNSSLLKFFVDNPLLLVLLSAWVIGWKGLALWKAARLSHKWWFIIIFIANTVGILEIIYIYFVARKYVVDDENSDEQIKGAIENK